MRLHLLEIIKKENYDLFNQEINLKEIAKIYKKSKLKGRFVKI